MHSSAANPEPCWFRRNGCDCDNLVEFCAERLTRTRCAYPYLWGGCGNPQSYACGCEAGAGWTWCEGVRRGQEIFCVGSCILGGWVVCVWVNSMLVMVTWARISILYSELMVQGYGYCTFSSGVEATADWSSHIPVILQECVLREGNHGCSWTSV